EQIGAMAGRERAGPAAERLGATSDGRLPERETRRVRLAQRREGAAALAEALAVFEPAQLLDRTERNVAVGADAPAPARFYIGQQGEEAVAEIALGRGAEPRDRSGGGEPPGLGVVHVGRMDQAPGLIDRRVVEEPLHGPRTRPRQALLDLAGLLGDVNVD